MGSYDVKVTIDLTKPIGKVGFGMPLLLVENATEAVDYTVVSNQAEIVAAGFAAETEVYKSVADLVAGDVVDVEGFLSWYENALDMHITKITK